MADSNSFDIKSLLDFNLAKFLCKNCYAMLYKMEYFTYKESKEIHSARCPICKISYLPTGQFSLDPYWPEGDFEEWIKKNYRDNLLEFSDLINHSRTLAKTVKNGQNYINSTPEQRNWFFVDTPLRTILRLLKQARKFLHFITYGSISHQLIGVLKLVALDIPVRGVISNVNTGDSTVNKLTEYKSDSAYLDVKVFKSKVEDKYNRDLPHQKLVIIDGLVALKGSANFTLSGYRKVAKGHEILEFVTDTEQVAELNNRYFSPIFGELSNKKEIKMYGEGDIPF